MHECQRPLIHSDKESIKMNLMCGLHALRLWGILINKLPWGSSCRKSPIPSCFSLSRAFSLSHPRHAVELSDPNCTGQSICQNENIHWSTVFLIGVSILSSTFTALDRVMFMYLTKDLATQLQLTREDSQDVEMIILSISYQTLQCLSLPKAPSLYRIRAGFSQDLCCPLVVGCIWSLRAALKQRRWLSGTTAEKPKLASIFLRVNTFQVGFSHLGASGHGLLSHVDGKKAATPPLTPASTRRRWERGYQLQAGLQLWRGMVRVFLPPFSLAYPEVTAAPFSVSRTPPAHSFLMALGMLCPQIPWLASCGYLNLSLNSTSSGRPSWFTHLNTQSPPLGLSIPETNPEPQTHMQVIY